MKIAGGFVLGILIVFQLIICYNDILGVANGQILGALNLMPASIQNSVVSSIQTQGRFQIIILEVAQILEIPYYKTESL